MLNNKNLREAARETIVFAVLLVVLVAAVVTAMAVRITREVRRWRRFRLLLQEWAEERERRGSA